MGIGENFSNRTPAWEIIQKYIDKVPKIKKLLQSKESDHQGEETAYRRGENSRQLHIRDGGYASNVQRTVRLKQKRNQAVQPTNGKMD